MKLTPDPYQVETINYMIKHPYSIAALEMGLGKTLCALGVWEKVGGKCLVICPAYLVLNWQNEIRKCLGDDPIIGIVRKGVEIKKAGRHDFRVISYNLAQKAEHFFEWADMVILDEGHEIKSMKAKRTEFIHKAVYENSIKRVHVLTGTPISNRVEEYYSLLALMNYNPDIKDSEFLSRFPDSIAFADYFSHRHEFTIEIRNRFIPIVKWTGVRNQKELKKYLENKYIRFKSEDVLSLDPIRFKDVLMSEKADMGLLDAFNSWANIEGNERATPNKKAEAALNTSPFTIQYVKGILEEVDSVVIYTDHVESCKAIAKALDMPAITGEMSATRRHEIGKNFQAGNGRGIVATIKSFSTGVDLTRAKDMVFNDPPWVPGHLKQAIYRIQRKNQTSRCTIHRIHGSPQGKTIYETLEDKLKTIERVT